MPVLGQSFAMRFSNVNIAKAGQAPAPVGTGVASFFASGGGWASGCLQHLAVAVSRETSFNSKRIGPPARFTISLSWDIDGFDDARHDCERI